MRQAGFEGGHDIVPISEPAKCDYSLGMSGDLPDPAAPKCGRTAAWVKREFDDTLLCSVHGREWFVSST